MAVAAVPDAADAAAYDFVLPPERIAQHPARPREAARLLEVGDALHDSGVADLPFLLRPGDLLVVNDTEVTPAKLAGWRGEARIGITLDRPGADGTWRVLVRNARRLRVGDAIRFDPEFSATVLDVDGGDAVLRFHGDLSAALDRIGTLALPPYIARPNGPLPEDVSDYQTVFACRPGAVAAPTAGLHFSEKLLAEMAARRIGRVAVTLHVGAGTFLPMRADRVADHRLHAERGEVGAAAVAAIAATRAAGGRIVAVGTTTLRLLETAALDGSLRPFAGETDIFIRPGFTFRVADLLLTNFHLPRSTLFMLVCAFAGPARMHAAYAHAIAEQYRFYSYGDACLLHRAAA